MAKNAWQDLKERGFIYQNTNEEVLEQKLANEQLTFYIGFDPTGDSLHVGHLLPVMAMRRMQKYGHKPIVLVGGATGMIGDPSGKSSARPILTEEKIQHNVDAIRSQLSKFISVDNAIFANNADWMRNMNYLDFLRQTGYRFSVNRMLQMDSVKSRLEDTLSFLEFSYMLLQAYDFQILFEKHHCTLEMGGQDQWGNIVMGIDLVRKVHGEEVFGITMPLLMDSSGNKFGKSNGSAVWLDPNRTSTFDYYQFWRNCSDSDVPRLLKYFTTLPVEEIDELAKLEAPAINRAKEILAYEATALAHSPEEAAKSYLAAGNKFGFADPEGKIFTSSEIKNVKIDPQAGLKDLPTLTLDRTQFEGEGYWIVQLFSDTQLTASNGDARRLIQGGGAYINDERINDVNFKITLEKYPNEFIVKAGKKQIKRIVIQ